MQKAQPTESPLRARKGAQSSVKRYWRYDNPTRAKLNPLNSSIGTTVFGITKPLELAGARFRDAEFCSPSADSGNPAAGAFLGGAGGRVHRLPGRGGRAGDKSRGRSGRGAHGGLPADPAGRPGASRRRGGSRGGARGGGGGRRRGAGTPARRNCEPTPAGSRGRAPG